MRSDWLQDLLPHISRRPLLLEELPWPVLQESLETGHHVLLLPVGATEQHGPHLPVNTDTLIATAACQAASALTGALVLPAIPYSVSIGHTEKWPGTFAIYHETLMLTVREISRWALAAGWNRLLIVNSHFGNDAALRCAVDRLRFDHVGELFLTVRNTWTLTEEIEKCFTHDAADWHANDAETAILKFIAPGLVRTACGAIDDPDRTAGCVFPHMVAHTSSNGVTGRPSEASAEGGGALLRSIAEALANVIERCRLEKPPLEWSRTTRAFAA